MTKVFLCSFASPDLDLSVKRFTNQAKDLKFYEDIKVFGEKELSNEIKNQINYFYKQKKIRLYGYACWKAFIIKKYLKTLPENSILQYSDIGCHFNPKGLDRLKDYIKLTDKYNLLTFQYKLPNWKIYSDYKFQQYFEYEYTKADAWNNLDIIPKSNILKSEQIWSGNIFFKNNSLSNIILNKWEEILKINSLIDDSFSNLNNHPSFIEHRHDQSIFSLICKKHNVFSLSASECEWAEYKMKKTWNHLEYYPILAKRDKKYSLFKRFFNRQQKNLKRFFKIN